jgi:hypothetical protein
MLFNILIVGMGDILNILKYIDLILKEFITLFFNPRFIMFLEENK